MKSKQYRIALLSFIFILCGCMSQASYAPFTMKSAQKNNVNNDVLDRYKSQSLKGEIFESYAKDDLMSTLIKNVRWANGELKLPDQLQSTITQIYDQAKQENAKQKALERLELAKVNTNVFTPKMTTYGLDCVGCKSINGRGGTAMGIQLDFNLGVLQPDGSWASGIKYGNYNIIAADKKIPMCSIIMIEGHGYYGLGLTPEQPIYAMVLDRGGAIKDNHFDLYIGSQQAHAVSYAQKPNPKATILRLGGQVGRGCALE